MNHADYYHYGQSIKEYEKYDEDRENHIHEIMDYYQGSGYSCTNYRASLILDMGYTAEELEKRYVL